MKIAVPITVNNFDFSRASIATYYDDTGLLVTAGVDELRIGYNPETLDLIGPIIEAEATNLLEHSNDFLDADWAEVGGGSSTITAAASTSPDGTTNATLYERTASGTILIRQSIAAGLQVFSVYAKALGSETCILRLTVGDGISSDETSVYSFNSTSGGGFEAHTSEQKLQDGWYRFSIGADVAASGYAEIQLLGSTGNRCYLFGAQVEETTTLIYTPTSYIETITTTETRAADIENDVDVKLVSSNVDENDAPVWDSGDSYVADETVIVLGEYHNIYRSIGSNTNKFPPDNLDEWTDEGATNRWRMFDMTVGSEKQTISDGSDNTIDVVVGVNQIINSVTLLNLYASSARIIMRDGEGNIVYDYEQGLLSGSYESNWYSFLFGSRNRITSLALTDLPAITPSTIQLILEGGDEDAKIGKMILGSAVDIGCTRYGTSVGIVDFSRKERDAFGNNVIVPRRYVDRVDFDVQILTSRVDEVKRLLASIRATPVVYIGDDGYDSTIIHGFYRDFSISILPKRSDLSLQVEGI